MPAFKFNTITRADISTSRGGKSMLAAIDYNGSKHLLITGCPGSGKTTVTIMRAKRLVNNKKSIGIFIYQKLLATSIRHIEPIIQNRVFSFYKWWYQKFGFLARNSDETYMIDKLKNTRSVDEIFIDEGQDFEARIFRTLLEKCSKMTVGADNAQQIHQGLNSGEIKTELEKKNRVNHIKLEYNYRNTFEVYNFARFFLSESERANNPIILENMPKGNGEKPVIFQVLNEDDKLAQIKILLKDASDKNVAILVATQDDVNDYYEKVKAIISEWNGTCSMYHSGLDNEIKEHHLSNVENVLVTTYTSAKGLEFQMVIMPDMENAMSKDSMSGKHCYVGCTRAKENLFLLFNGENKPNYLNDFDVNSYEFVTTKPEENRNLESEESEDFLF